MPDSYRPTLFDFLAHKALAFYTAGEQAAAKAEDAFELPADSPIFAPVDEFLAWKPETTDRASPTVKAHRLYQKLLPFHRADAEPAARLDADLLRLQFGYNAAVRRGEERPLQGGPEAVRRPVGRPRDRRPGVVPLGRRCCSRKANWSTHVSWPSRAVNAFPDSIGGRLCYNLIAQIEAKSATITTERVWNEPLPTIQVRYRNVTKVYFRVVPLPFEERLKTRPNRPEQLDEQRTRNAARQTAGAGLVGRSAGHRGFPGARARDRPRPQDLKPGFYFLIASHDPKFGEAEQRGDVHRRVGQRPGPGDPLPSTRAAELRGFVLHAVTGEPLAGAEVRAWYHDPQQHARGRADDARRTKRAVLAGRRPQQNYLLHVRHGGQELATARDYHSYRGDTTLKPYQRTVFFTDRALYRPGQTIQYKGLCIDVDQDSDNYQTLANQTLTVIFSDRNGKEIARQQHRTNDYGSFSGSFTAPRDRLLGQMSIRVDGEPRGQTQFNVEEYKRPKFQVTLERPKAAAKLNAEVTLAGQGPAYTGAAIGGAKVEYRVVREVRYPAGGAGSSGGGMPPAESQEIAHGTAVTKADGTFHIEFTARPDLSVPEADEPTFHFTVHADVTDITGETPSGAAGRAARLHGAASHR